jgi:hypothetical protein
MQRRIFGARRDEVAGEWKNCIRGVHDLYSSPSIIRMTKRNQKKKEQESP